MIDQTRNSATVQAFWQAISAKDIDGYLALFAEDAVAFDPVNRAPLTTQEARRASMQATLNAFAHLTARVDSVTHCGDHTATKWTISGESPDGHGIALEGVDVIRHDDAGKIAEMWGYYPN